ncbi:MAG TPA: aldose epimerase family protein [Beijerinckiaceae bacterium]|jgi:aldose 1-epimerase
MNPTLFGTLDDTPVYEITLRSAAGAEAKVITWGAVVRDLQVPRPGGGLQRVVLGSNSLDDYWQHSPHFGAIAGRYANRIAGGRFSVDERAYQLPLNQDGKHSLHGGGQGFGKRPWQLAAATESSVTLTLVSPDGDHGYPGDLTVTCTYRLLEPATLRVELSATTTDATPVNLCHHSYFKLDGAADILDHRLDIAADFWTPVDADLIPTGEVRAVAGTPFDFRAPRAIGHAGTDGTRTWYDHNWVLRRERVETPGRPRPLAYAAGLTSSRSGLRLEVWTTEPGLQFYDGFKINLPVPGLDGAPYGANAGLCLEPQHFPDSPNRPHFPSTILRPGEVYRQVTEYRFGPA